MNPEKLAKLQQNVRIGGKGSVRRKKKVHKPQTADGPRLQATLKRLGVNNIPGCEEVNLFKDDGTVIHFVNPKVQASINANTYVISGNSETKKLQDLLPGILSQLGAENLSNLKQLAEGFNAPEAAAAAAAAGGAAPAAAAGADDDDVPELVDNFEAGEGGESK